MPEALSVALATPGLIWLLLTIGAAGIVRGFTGFGTALIFVPVAGQFLPAEEVVLIITVTGIASAGALLPRAIRQADHKEVLPMGVAAMVTIPLGIYLMTQLDALTVRWAVAAIALITLLTLITGWRYHQKVRLLGLLLIGGAAGIVGGMTGLTGPVVIMFYLASTAQAQTVRANTIIFLAILDVWITTSLFIGGLTDWSTVWVGLILCVPYFITSLIGQALFDPRYERVYRLSAYAVIAVAVVSGIPLFD